MIHVLHKESDCTHFFLTYGVPKSSIVSEWWLFCLCFPAHSSLVTTITDYCVLCQVPKLSIVFGWWLICLCFPAHSSGSEIVYCVRMMAHSLVFSCSLLTCRNYYCDLCLCCREPASSLTDPQRPRPQLLPLETQNSSLLCVDQINCCTHFYPSFKQRIREF